MAEGQWVGEIVDLQHRTPPDYPAESWWVEIMTAEGRSFDECTTQVIWETLDFGQSYTLNVNNVPCP
jgi:hypothetical protein